MSHTVRHCLLLLVCLLLPAGAGASSLPPGVERLHKVEGITEYRLENGLRVLLFPDPAKPTVTVNVTYLVGSRHENYGETGMAHLLEHLIFKGSKNYPNPTKEFTARGFRMNGTTWLDRTNYFVTFTATDDNLKWALGWSADAMVNSFIARKDLDTEMSVVRNEFEMGENSPTSVMMKRMQSVLFDWHNYGNSTIGARSDIENVRIENLQAFYRLYYQPDNAVLTVSGKFDETRTLAWIAEEFGRIAKPQRTLPAQWTAEPTADGERQFIVRRQGEVQLVVLAYRTPSALHPDAFGLGFATEMLGNMPNGRLYKALVQSGLAAQVFAYPVHTRDPGFVIFGAVVKKGEAVDTVREKMIETIEGGFKNEPASPAEMKRTVEQAHTQIDQVFANPESFAVRLSEYIALGDWRLFFYARDRLDQVRAAEVDAAAAKYLVRDNRVAGLFIPEDAPQRAAIPPAQDSVALLAGYRPKEDGDAGEAFDPSQDNIARRSATHRAGDLKIALLPKKNRGQTVNVSIALHWGDLATLHGRQQAGGFASSLLARGTSRYTRQQLADEMTRLKMSGGLTSFQTTRPHLDDALKLVAHVFRDATFPEAEFAEIKRQTLTGLQSQLDNPDARARDALESHFDAYLEGDPRHYTPLAQRIAEVERLTLAEVRRYHRELMGTARGEIAIVGDFDAENAKAALLGGFPGFVSPAPYRRIDRAWHEVAPKRMVIDTPDKENATLRARLDLALRDDEPDAAALFVANYIFGGSPGLSNRLINRLRQKDGLSYGASSGLGLGSRERLSTWTFGALVAPQNLAKAEAAFFEELERARRDGFTAAELDEAQKGILQSRAVTRSQDSAVAANWAALLDQERTWQFSKDFEARIAALSVADIDQAFRKYIDPARLTMVAAGDAKKGVK